MPESVDSGIREDLPVAEVMRLWPATIAVFLDHGMACPGCPMAGFMTVAEAARSYSHDAAALTGALNLAARPMRGDE